MRRHKTLITLLGIAAFLYWAVPALMDFAAGNVRVTFYGRVIDTHDNPIPNFKISARVARKPFMPLWESREEYGDPVTLTTDANGCFEFSGGRGCCVDLSFGDTDWGLAGWDAPLPRRYDKWASTTPPDAPERAAWFRMKKRWEPVHPAR